MYNNHGIGPAPSEKNNTYSGMVTSATAASGCAGVKSVVEANPKSEQISAEASV